MKTITFISVICFLHRACAAPVSLSPTQVCGIRLEKVERDQSLHGSIQDEPRYVPLCDADKVAWQVTQYTDLDGGYWFCVNPETGIPDRNSPINSIRDRLNCYAEEPQTIEMTACQQERFEQLTLARQSPNVADVFIPKCDKEGLYLAIQEDAFSRFCVDLHSGVVIPKTTIQNDQVNLLTQEVCQEFSQLWRSFLADFGIDEIEQEVQEENMTEESCPYGFEYEPHGCPRTCVPGHNMEEEVSCNHPKPVCTCPSGYYEYNDTCITSVECLYLKEEFNTIDTYSLWPRYLTENANSIIRVFRGNSQRPPKEPSNPSENETDFGHRQPIQGLFIPSSYYKGSAARNFPGLYPDTSGFQQLQSFYYIPAEAPESKETLNHTMSEKQLEEPRQEDNSNNWARNRQEDREEAQGNSNNPPTTFNPEEENQYNIGARKSAV